MVEQKELNCQKAVGMVLDGKYQPAYYSIGKYREDALCLQQESNGKWSTYIGFRRQRKLPEVYDNVVDACLSLIRRLSKGNDEETLELSDNFLNLIIRDQIA